MFSEKSQASLQDRRPPSEPLAERIIETGRDGFAAGYVAALRGARRLARVTGLLAALDRRRHRRDALFARSLFAVNDIDDMDRLDLPWWTFGAIASADAFLAALRGRARVFEFGSGASTLWLARRAGEVVSVEHDVDWWPSLAARFRGVANIAADLVEAVPSETPTTPSGRAGWSGLDFTAYVRSIRRAGGPFDLVVIDGRARDACLLEALPHLAPSGMVVLDNSGRRRYAAAIAASGLAIRRFDGVAPSVPLLSQTALMARDRAMLEGL